MLGLIPGRHSWRVDLVPVPRPLWQTFLSEQHPSLPTDRVVDLPQSLSCLGIVEVTIGEKFISTHLKMTGRFLPARGRLCDRCQVNLRTPRGVRLPTLQLP